HGGRARAVQRLSAQHLLPRRLPRPHRARRQHPRRRPARHARSEDGEARMNVLDIRDLSIALPAGAERAQAVCGVSLSGGKGEILCLVGESGSGKSVIAQSVMGLLPKSLPLTAGSISLQDEDITRAPEDRLRQLRTTRMSMIFQEPMTALNPVM